MVKVLGLFDGLRPLGEVLQMLPSHLKDHGLDIVIFLLRWHMLVNVDAYLVNLLAMPLPVRELTLLLQQQQQLKQQQPAASRPSPPPSSVPPTPSGNASATPLPSPMRQNSSGGSFMRGTSSGMVS